MGPSMPSLASRSTRPTPSSTINHKHRTSSIDDADHPTLQRRASVRIRHEQQQNKQKNAEKALDLANTKSLKKAFRLLVESGHVNPTPGAFCTWIRDHIDSIDENQLGDYLGEGK